MKTYSYFNESYTLLIILNPITVQDLGTPPPDRRVENENGGGETLRKFVDFFAEKPNSLTEIPVGVKIGNMSIRSVIYFQEKLLLWVKLNEDHILY